VKRIENFGRSWSFRPSAVVAPKTVEDLARAVRRASKVRVMGSGHSWSKAIVTDGTLVSLHRMNKILHVDEAGLRVTVQAGITLSELIAALDRRGLALANLGSIDEQTIAGAISTGTHGTGRDFQCLAAQVESLALVDGEGARRFVDKAHPDFGAIVVGLGCFGIIYEVTLSVVRAFQMHAITDRAPFDEVIENLDTYISEHDHFKFWWLVPQQNVIVFKNKRTQLPRNDSDLTRWFKDEFLSVYLYRALIQAERFDRKRIVRFANTLLGREAGRRYERICKSYVGFLTPSPPVHRETEWAFDYSDAKGLLERYRAHLARSTHAYSFIQEVRFTKADTFPLSPAYGRDSIWLSLYNIDRDDAWNDQLAGFNAFAKAEGGRPHWGKEADFDPLYLAKAWPTLASVRKQMKAYDPKGKFINPWVEQIFGGV
jgi:FAD/FMN-containing dehydrogenase